MPSDPVYNSRFNTPAEAIAYAQANGQGPLTVAANGSTTNRFGENMVFDSSGNLAPAPRTTPLVINPMPNPAPGLAVNPGSFNDPAQAVAYAIANGQGPLTPAQAVAYAIANGQGQLRVGADGVIINSNGQRMVFDSSGNSAPGTTFNPTPNPAPVVPVYNSRFNTPAEAIAYAQANGQGPLTVAADGSITNRFGQKMVSDSDGNLAPGPMFTPLPVLPVFTSRFNTPSEAIAYAQANGQGQLKMGADGVITNRIGEKMVFDSFGNLAPQPMSNFFNSGLTSSISGLGPAELKNLYSQVGDAMYAPGFSYSAHIAANTAGGVFKAPVYMPADTTKLIPMPVVGSTAYQSLLAATGGASANPDFNYAAHIAATTSQNRSDLSYDDAIRLMIETGRSDIMNIDLAAHRQSTGSFVGMGNNYTSPVAAKVGAALIENSFSLMMPPVGSPAFKALSLSTGGASERSGFNYAAHVAAITSQTVLKSLSYSEVMTLIAETGKSDFTNFDVLSYQKDKSIAAPLVSRLFADPSNANLTLPNVGSPEYQQILQETGLKDLTGFDFKAHLASKHRAELALSTMYGSASDDVIVSNPTDKKGIFMLGQGNDTLTATNNPDILIGGEGSDALNGGLGIDKAAYSGAASEYKVTIGSEGKLVVADKVESRDGSDALSGVERISFADKSLAFDINGNAGESYRLYKAAFNRAPDLQGIGYWMQKLDNGANLVNDVANGFVNSKEFETLYGANSSNAAFIEKLYQNVLNRAPEPDGFAFYDKALNSGVSRATLLANFSQSNENIEQVAPLVGQGISYIEHIV